ncbi:MAG: HAD family phosphatase [Cyanobacteria bacterium J06635_15]
MGTLKSQSIAAEPPLPKPQTPNPKPPDPKTFDNVIFDLGGVIINIRYENTLDAFSRLCGFDVRLLYTQHRQAPLFDQFETGQISADAFRHGLRQLLNINTATDEAIDDAWNAMLLDIPRSRIDLLQVLRQHKRIFLLSNTNRIHKAKFDAIFAAAHGDRISDLADLFEQVYYSHLMGDRKPKPSIFQTVIANHNLNPSRTLFIEDTRQHIEGAQQVGLQTFHLQPGCDIVDLNLATV